MLKEIVNLVQVISKQKGIQINMKKTTYMSLGNKLKFELDQ